MIENFRPLGRGDDRWFVCVCRAAPEQYRADEHWYARDLLTIIGWCDGSSWSVGKDKHNRMTSGDIVVFDDRYGRARALHDLYDGSDGLGTGREEVRAIYVTSPEMEDMDEGLTVWQEPGEVRPYDWSPDEDEWNAARRRNPFSTEPLRARHPMTTYVAVRERWAKIGRTSNLDRRIVSLATTKGSSRPEGMTPGKVRLVFKFTGDVEASLHARWAEFRVPGTEWFRLEGGFAEWLAFEEASRV